MHVISRYEATIAVTKGAVLKSGVRVSKILPKENTGTDYRKYTFSYYMYMNTNMHVFI
jgi:hypothetical protein